MDAALAARLERLKGSIRNAIRERNEQFSNSVQAPNEFWRTASSHLEYIFDLTPEHLLDIRLHVSMGHYLGSWWAEVMYDKYKYEGNARATQTLRYVKEYEKYTSGLEERFWATEPTEVDSSRHISFLYRGKYINWDVVIRQRTLFHTAKILQRLSSQERSLICEVGSGYGSLAHQVSRCFEPGTNCYLCVDYPETLFWSSAYLLINNPTRKVWVYDPASSPGTDLSEVAREHDFVMLPNYLAPHCRLSTPIDLAINEYSFQEMTTAQVYEYMEFFKRHDACFVFTKNAEKQHMNDSLKKNVSDIVSEYFELAPTREEMLQFHADTLNVDSKFLFIGLRRPGQGAPCQPSDRELLEDYHCWFREQLRNQGSSRLAG
jgi:hypothetical protein